MLTRRRRGRREQGQVLILALAFIAAFGLVVAAVLAFASTAALQHAHTETTAQTDAAGEGGAAFAAADAARSPSLEWCPNGNTTPPNTNFGSVTMADGNNTQAHYNETACDPGQTSTSVAAQGHCLLCILNQTPFGSTPKYTPTTAVFSAQCAQATTFCLQTTGGDDYINGSIKTTSNNGEQLQACAASGQCPGTPPQNAHIALLDVGQPGGATYPGATYPNPSVCCSPATPTPFTSPIGDPLASIGDPVAAGIPLPGGCTSWQTCNPLNCQAPPSAPAVAPTPAGGRTSYSYAVVAFNATGDLPESANGSTSTGPSNLDTTHYNTVSWGAIGGGATGVKVIRTAGGAAQGIIATMSSAAAGSLRDTGLAAQPYAGTPQGTWSGSQGCTINLSGNQAVSFNLYPGVWNTISVSGRADVVLQPGVYVLTGPFTNTGNGIVCAPGTITISGQNSTCAPSTGVTLYLACTGSGAVAYAACPSAGAPGGNISLSGGGNNSNQVNLNSTPCPGTLQVPNCPGYDGLALLADPHLIDANTGGCVGGAAGQCAITVSGNGGSINGSVDTRSAGIVITGGGGDSIAGGFLITNSLSIQVNGSSGTGMALNGPGTFVAVGNSCSVLVLNVYTGTAPAQLPTAVIQTNCGTTKQSGVIYFNYIP